ncbi:3D domain-containing protein [Pseudothermotoga thermarum]|uniref:Peptidase M23 n=1 Tax=Pseudothermotoga thermarum DSM 5069 TaxID=688269 RepID=F7YV63_9THEM|nr:3D domain-containing protein [Pseudothermotoga thermarum]AEH50362.1 Peptidase M23 [Pseudothermotoga thermarum DSM 5069]
MKVKSLIFILPFLILILTSCMQYDRDVMEKLNRRLDDLEYKLMQIERNQNATRQEVQKLQEEINRLSEEIAYAKRMLDLQRTTPTVSQEDVDKILSRLSSLEMRFSQLSVALNISDIRELIYKLGDLEAAQKQQQLAYEKFVRETQILLEQVNAREIAERLDSLTNSLISIRNQINQALELEARIKALESSVENLVAMSDGSPTNISKLESDINQLRVSLRELESNLRREMDKRFFEFQQRTVYSGTSSDLQNYIANTTALVRQLTNELEYLRGLVREYDRDRFLKLDQGYITYVVKPGDTLSAIARAYGFGADKIKQIVELNQLQDPNRLLVGQRLKIPIDDPSSLFRYPLDVPVDPKNVLSSFGQPVGGGVRTGVEIYVDQPTKVRAILPGKVVNILKDDGYWVRIDHGNGILAVYGNLSTVEVSQGQWVGIGQFVGTVDRIFHFEIWIDGEPKDPFRIIFKYAGQFEATYYTEWEDGKLPEHPTFRITTAGTIPKNWWTLAADPSVLPLGTVVYIPQFSDKPNNGFFVVEDTGLAIKGRIIDIYLNDLAQARANMRSFVDVYIVTSK